MFKCRMSIEQKVVDVSIFTNMGEGMALYGIPFLLTAYICSPEYKL